MLARPLVVAPLAAGLFLAPWFTLLCRSAMAGLVLSGAVPAMLSLAGYSAWLLVGDDPADVAAADALQRAVTWWGMVVVSGIAAVGAWQAIQRLEVVERRGELLDVPWPRLQRETWPPRAGTPGAAVRRRSPWGRLLAKELRLHAPLLPVAVLYVIAWLAVAASALFRPAGAHAVAEITSTLYGCLVVLLAGALTCAEERQWGTMPSQLLLPVPLWQQWSLKVATALSLTLLLALGLPGLLATLSPAIGGSMREELVAMKNWPFLTVGVAGIALAIYVSSVSSGTLIALVRSAAAAAVVVVVLQTWVVTVGQLLYGLTGPTDHGGFRRAAWVGMYLHPTLQFGGTALLALWLGFRNYRVMDLSARRIAGHAGLLFLWWTAVAVLVVGISRFW
jgi:hypothetical protein